MKLVGQLILFLLLSNTAHAEMDCLASDLVVDRKEVLNLTEPSQLNVRLPNSRDRDYFTYAAFHLTVSEDKNYSIFFDHVLPQQQNVAIPYSVYKIRLELGTPGTEKFWSFEQDFSENCTQAGRSIYPGQWFPVLAKAPHWNGEVLRIKIWGRHI
jgi:hypothetical protein